MSDMPSSSSSQPATRAASRRQFLGLGAAGVALSALAGCSGGSTGAGAGKNTFTFTFWGTGEEKKAVSAVVADYAKSVQLTPNAQSIPQNYETKLNTLLAANNPPDAGYLTQGMAMRLGAQGKIVNVHGVDGFDKLLPSTLHYYAPGKAVSQTCIEALGLWYDTDAAASAGVAPPPAVDQSWDWDALIAAADALTVDGSGRKPSDSGFDPKDVKRYGFAPPTSLITLTALLKSNGVDLFDSAGTKTNIDSAESISVLQAIADLIFEHRVSPTAAQSTSLGGTTALQLAGGHIAMAIDGAWALLDLNAAEGLSYDVGVLPKFQEYYTTDVSGANAVFTASTHQEQGLDLLLELADPEKVSLYADGLWMPALESYYTDEELISSWVDNDAHPAGFRTAVVDPTRAHAVNYPAYEVKNFSTIEAAFNGSLPTMFTTKTDVEQAAKKLAEQINPLMQGAYEDSE